MFNMRKYAVVLLVLAVSTAAYGTLAPFSECPSADPSAPSICTIHSVDIEPCPEATQGKPCRFRKGSNSNITIEFTPNFDATTLESRAYWPTAAMELPLLGMESNACLSTTCPIQAGQKRTYTITIPISKMFPSRSYDVKWKLWNENQQECCFLFQIKLQR